MIEFRKIVIFLFVSILLFYMIRLFFFTKRKYKSNVITFSTLIFGLSLLEVATFFDIIVGKVNNQYMYMSIKACFSLGGIVFVVGVMLWSNYTERMIAILEERARTDDLTGVLNRNGLEQIYNKVAEEEKMFYIIVCDLDGTKRVNDNKGHLFGDKYIINSTKIITNIIGTKGNISRTGGDEFVILLEYVPVHDLEQIILKIKRMVYEISPEQDVGISMGFSVFPEDGTTFEELMRVADDNMYADKKRKKSVS